MTHFELFYQDYFREPVVKSPPEPTRVRSPEGSVRSPDPINWTVPLDTGKTFSVTQSVKDGGQFGIKLFVPASTLEWLSSQVHNFTSTRDSGLQYIKIKYLITVDIIVSLLKYSFYLRHIFKRVMYWYLAHGTVKAPDLVLFTLFYIYLSIRYKAGCRASSKELDTGALSKTLL